MVPSSGDSMFSWGTSQLPPWLFLGPTSDFLLGSTFPELVPVVLGGEDPTPLSMVLYLFSIAAIVNDYKCSNLNQHKSIISQFRGGQKPSLAALVPLYSVLQG